MEDKYIGTTDLKTADMEVVRTEIADLQPHLRAAFKEMGPSLDASQITVVEGTEEEKGQWVAKANERLRLLGERRMALTAAAKAQAEIDAAGDWLDAPADDGSGTPFPDGKSHGRPDPWWKAAAKSDAVAEYKGGVGPIAEVAADPREFLGVSGLGAKTVMSTGAGFAPQAIRTGERVRAAFQAPEVVDLIPIRTTTQNAYVFMRQTTRTNAAAEAAESVQGTLVSLAESAFVWTEISETIRKIGHFVPVSDEQLEDIEGMEELLRNDMLDGVRERLSSQILVGTGTAPQIEGFHDAGRTGVTDVDTTGDFIADAVDKMIEQVAVTGFAAADGIILHPSDWHGYRRATTADGIYIAGHPSRDVPATLWALPVVLTTEQSQGTGLVGAFARYSRLAVKRGVEIQISSEHASYFIQGVKAIKAEMRATLAVLREEAFAKTNDIVVS